MHTKWTSEELGIIEAKAELYTPKQIASILKRHGYFRTPIAIATKLWALGYSTSPFLDTALPAIMQYSFPLTPLLS